MTRVKGTDRFASAAWVQFAGLKILSKGCSSHRAKMPVEKRQGLGLRIIRFARKTLRQKNNRRGWKAAPGFCLSSSLFFLQILPSLRRLSRWVHHGEGRQWPSLRRRARRILQLEGASRDLLLVCFDKGIVRAIHGVEREVEFIDHRVLAAAAAGCLERDGGRAAPTTNRICAWRIGAAELLVRNQSIEGVVHVVESGDIGAGGCELGDHIRLSADILFAGLVVFAEVEAR
jgi:hypothetical protein